MKAEYNGMTITGTAAEMFEFIKLLMESRKPDVEKPEKKSEKKDIDMGKVKALRNAGWSLAKIADEMGVSAQTIANRLKEVEA